MRLIDTHAHLNHEDLEPEAEEILERAHRAGVEKIVVVGYDVPSSERAVALAQKHHGLHAVVGLHPYEAAKAGDADLARIRALAREPHVVGVGEIGLDYHGDEFAPKVMQESLLRSQLAIAQELSLPVVIHQRDSGLDILAPLQEFQDVPKVFHCFAGDGELLRGGLAAGAYISFAGPLTFRRNDDLRKLCQDVPLDRLLVETDSPYLAPVPYRGKRNEPAYVAETLRALAQARKADVEALAEATSRNAARIFRLGEASILRKY